MCEEALAKASGAEVLNTIHPPSGNFRFHSQINASTTTKLQAKIA